MKEEEQKLVLDQQISEVVTQSKGCLQIMANRKQSFFFLMEISSVFWYVYSV